MENEKIVLEASEMTEGYDVTFIRNGFLDKDVVVAINEGGYNFIYVDAYQLYLDLKRIYEGEENITLKD